jgi:hypothetical protein
VPLSSLALFAAIYAVAVASPGPGIAALVARVLSRGTGGMPAFVAGFVVGDLAWFAVAAKGFALVSTLAIRARRGCNRSARGRARSLRSNALTRAIRTASVLLTRATLLTRETDASLSARLLTASPRMFKPKATSLV